MNFDKLFEKYVKERINEREDGEEPEEFLARLYNRFENDFCPQLDTSPKLYVKALSNTDLLRQFKLEATSDCVSALTVDELASRRLASELHLMMLSEDNPVLRLTAVEILANTGGRHDLELYLDILESKELDSELREKLIEILKQNAAAVQEQLYRRAAGANLEYKTILGEIALAAPRDERTLRLLLELFNEGDNIPLYASYLGTYGDERAAAALYRALDTACYADFIELTNAIERLGGTVDGEMKDFSEDPTYLLIKGEENKPIV